MPQKISVVINTLNEEKNIQRALKSVDWIDEIIVCDMHSTDKTVNIAKERGARIVYFRNTHYVEPARNFAISKANNDWVLVLDADEEIPQSLKEKIIQLVNKNIISEYIEIPRKNIIFNKWMRASMWWPDYQVRLFKKGSVIWQDKIHSKPLLKGSGLKLGAEEGLAIVHHNYQTISQFIERMNRYTTIEAKHLTDEGYKFNWKDLIEKPLNEFLSRFFTNKGYLDGLHGLSLSFLQSFSFLVVYLKLWELSRFKESDVNLIELEEEKNKNGEAIKYWFGQTKKGGSFNKLFKIFNR